MTAKFTWFPKLTITAEKVPEELRPTFVWSLIQYGTYGIEPELEWPLDAVFEGVRDDIDNSKNSRMNNTGGRPRKAKKAAAEVPEDEKKPVSETEKTPVLQNENPGFETLKPNSYHTKPSHTNPNQSKSNPLPPLPKVEKSEFELCEEDEDGNAFAAFAKECVDVFNAETGSDYRLSGGTVMLGLRRIYDNGRTTEDVRRVIRAKQAQWGRDPEFSSFLRPKTLFGENFEEYLAEQPPGQAGIKAACPTCGCGLVPIGEVVSNPKDPSKLFCPKCRKAIARKAAA